MLQTVHQFLKQNLFEKHKSIASIVTLALAKTEAMRTIKFFRGFTRRNVRQFTAFAVGGAGLSVVARNFYRISQRSFVVAANSNDDIKKYDLIVIGGGSAGIASAKRAASYGAKVKLFEYKKLGGTCVNVGCVPKKLMWTASSIATTLDTYARHYGFIFGNTWKHKNNESDFDMKGLKLRRDDYVKFLNGIYGRGLDNLNIDHENSFAKFIDSNVVEANGQKYTADKILIAVGGFPYIPNIPVWSFYFMSIYVMSTGFLFCFFVNKKGKEYIKTSDDFFNELDHIPKKVAVVGAGYIAVELAQVMQGLGSDVSLFIRGDHPLRKFDILIQNGVHNALVHSGVNVVYKTNIDEIKKNGSKFSMIARDGKSYDDYDYVLYAIGRGPLAEELGLDKTKVLQDKRGFIISDEYEETAQKGVYAIGDINNKAALTPVAIRAGRKWADRLFGGKGNESKMDYTNIPTVVFTHPPVGTIGLSERETQEKIDNGELKGPMVIYESHFRNLMYGVMTEEDKIRTHMKLICVGPEEKVVGLHMIGEGADEMTQGFGVAIKMGATKADFDSVVAIHPSYVYVDIPPFVHSLLLSHVTVYQIQSNTNK